MKILSLIGEMIKGSHNLEIERLMVIKNPDIVDKILLCLVGLHLWPVWEIGFHLKFWI